MGVLWCSGARGRHDGALVGEPQLLAFHQCLGRRSWNSRHRRGVPIHALEVPLPRPMPVAFEFHHTTVERHSILDPSPAFGDPSRHILRGLLLVPDGRHVRGGRREHWVDVGAGCGDGSREKPVVGTPAGAPDRRYSHCFRDCDSGVEFLDSSLIASDLIKIYQHLGKGVNNVISTGRPVAGSLRL